MKKTKDRGWIILGFISLLLIVIGLTLAPPTEILTDLVAIIVSPALLITDFLTVGGLAATLVNVGLVGVIGTIIVYVDKSPVTGPIIAAYLTMVGFAFFGKTFLNIIPIVLGVHLYAWQSHHFRSYGIVAMFGTALGPLISQMAFHLGFGLPIAFAIGIGVGFFLPPVATQMLRGHQGFNLYNIGFTCGFIGVLAASMLRAFNKGPQSTLLWSNEYHVVLSLGFIVVCLGLIITGYFLDRKAFSSLRSLVSHSGALVTDFIVLEGTGTTLVNMGLTGFLGLAYIYLIGGVLNGPVIGGLLTIVGFAAFGKHIVNCLPVMLGVAIMAGLSQWQINAPGPVLAAIFGTTLAPISGLFGPQYGIIAGMIHLTVVMNVGFAHAGLNLYNNGFAGGIVATLMIGVLKAFKPGLLED